MSGGRGPDPRKSHAVPDFTWLPANDATRAYVEAVFEAGGARRCRCQALKVPGWIWRDTTQEERDAALLEQAGYEVEASPTLRRSVVRRHLDASI